MVVVVVGVCMGLVSHGRFVFLGRFTMACMAVADLGSTMCSTHVVGCVRTMHASYTHMHMGHQTWHLVMHASSIWYIHFKAVGHMLTHTL